VTGSDGDAIALSPYTGEPLGRMELPGKSHQAPIVANNTMYVLSDDGELTAYR